MICVAGVGGATFGHASVLLHDLEEYLLRHSEWSYDRKAVDWPDKPGEVEPLIEFIKLQANSISYMTPVASIMAMYAFLREECLLWPPRRRGCFAKL